MSRTETPFLPEGLPSTARPRWHQPRWVRALLGILAFAVLMGGLLLKARADLQADLKGDWRDETHSHELADRWHPLLRPLLWEWARSTHAVRFEYAAQAFLRRDMPDAGDWLELELARNPAQPFPWQADCASEHEDWIRPLGLDHPERLTRMVRLCLANLDQRTQECQFNAGFLTSLLDCTELSSATAHILGTEVPAPPPARARVLLALLPEKEEGSPVATLVQTYRRCARAEAPPTPSSRDSISPQDPRLLEERYRSAIPEDKYLVIEDRDHPGGLSLQEVRFLRTVAGTRTEDLRGLAAWILAFRGGDLSHLQRITRTDLAALECLHTYQLLEIILRLPQSRYTRACKEYASIRGRGYFRLHDPPPSQVRSLRPLPPAEEYARWQDWLRRYPDHAGADDAGYWMGRCLEWQGKRLEATRTYMALVRHPRGDGDMIAPIRNRLLVMLDVGLTPQELQSLVEQAPRDPWVDGMRYAWAVRYARAHDYRRALELTATITPTKLAPLWHPWRWWFHTGEFLQTTFYDQRQRWQELRDLGAPTTPSRRFALAQAWSTPESWRNGYLVLWQGGRAFHYDSSEFTTDDGLTDTLAAGCRGANPVAVALGLLQEVARDPATDRTLLEQTLALQVSLLARCLDYADREAIGPLDGYPEEVGRDRSLFASPRPVWYSREQWTEVRQRNEKQDWFRRQAIAIRNRLRTEFPRSAYQQQVDLDVYSLTGDPAPLQATAPVQVEPPREWRTLQQDALEYWHALLHV